MLSFQEINALIKTIDASSVQELELEGDGLRLLINKRYNGAAAFTQEMRLPLASAGSADWGAMRPASAFPAPAAPAAAVAAPIEESGQLHEIVSPIVGTFYRAPSPDKPPFVNIGDQVGERSVVCIIEAMKLMNTIEAECSGEIVSVLVGNGQLVEYGQPLFRVKKR